MFQVVDSYFMTILDVDVDDCGKKLVCEIEVNKAQFIHFFISIIKKVQDKCIPEDQSRKNPSFNLKFLLYKVPNREANNVKGVNLNISHV